MKKIIILVFLYFLLSTSFVYADVVLKIRAMNPSEEKLNAPINYPLPKEVAPEDVIGHKIIFSSNRPKSDIPNVSEFEIITNNKDGRYYVKQDIELLPKEIVTLEVNVKDVWGLDKSVFEDLKGQLKEALAGIDKDTVSKSGTIKTLKDLISREIEGIKKRQEMNSVKIVGIEKHIEAYRKNLSGLEQVFFDISMLKNLIRYMRTGRIK